MAGDWIKMRGNLWDDPRVACVCDLTDCGEAAAIGGMYWLWATADQHSEDGIMPGLTIRSLDRKTGIKGFGDALISIGWIADHSDGIRIIRFEEHNGDSAKKRAQTAKRVANFKENAKVTQPSLPDEQESVTDALPREREEKEKSSKPKSTSRADALATRLPADWVPDESLIDFCKTERPDLQAEVVAARFRDYWVAVPGVKGRKADWPATWRNWIRNEKAQARASPSSPSSARQNRIDNYAAEAAAARGKNGQQHSTGGTERDITGEAVRVA